VRIESGELRIVKSKDLTPVRSIPGAGRVRISDIRGYAPGTLGKDLWIHGWEVVTGVVDLAFDDG
jgi:hypothetical protein